MCFPVKVDRNGGEGQKGCYNYDAFLQLEESGIYFGKGKRPNVSGQCPKNHL